MADLDLTTRGATRRRSMRWARSPGTSATRSKRTFATCAECTAEVRALALGVVAAASRTPPRRPTRRPHFATALAGRRCAADVVHAGGHPDARGSALVDGSTRISVNAAWLAAAALLIVSVGLGICREPPAKCIGGLEGRFERSRQPPRIAPKLRLADATAPPSGRRCAWRVLTSRRTSSR